MTKKWEEHRDTIIRLYKTENKPLKDVREIMTHSYNFEASTRAYRSKLENWGIVKYNTRKRKNSAESPGSSSPTSPALPGSPAVWNHQTVLTSFPVNPASAMSSGQDASGVGNFPPMSYRDQNAAAVSHQEHSQARDLSSTSFPAHVPYTQTYTDFGAFGGPLPSGYGGYPPHIDGSSYAGGHGTGQILVTQGQAPDTSTGYPLSHEDGGEGDDIDDGNGFNG